MLEQRIDGTEARGGESALKEIPSVAGELLAMMSGDWDRRVVEADVVWLALHLARYTYIVHTCTCIHFMISDWA